MNMSIQSTDNVYFFESEKGVGGARPYASLSEEELTHLIQRFVSWAAMLATHPKLAASFGEASTAHITLATELRMAVKRARQENTYPNVILPAHKYTAAMTLMRQSRAVEPEFCEVLAAEHRKWENDYPM
jgi:hypothetical protein